MAAGDGNFAADLADRSGPRHDAPFLMVPDGTHPGAGNAASIATYGEIHDLAARMAGALAAAGAVAGDRILVQVAKSPAAVALYLACLRGGFVHVPLNPAFTTDEVGDFAHDAEPSVLVVDPTFVTDVAALDAVPTLLTLGPDGRGSLADAADVATPLPIVDRHPDDVAALLYTSGTTGRPKGAMLSHGSLRHNAGALHDIWRFDADDVLLHILPIFHVHGLFVALHCAMLSGIPVWFLPRFDPVTTVALLPHSTVMMGVPTHYVRLLDEPGFDRLHSAGMRLFTSGSAPMSEALFARVAAAVGHRPCERYGMSEAGIICSNPYDGDRVAGTVGFPLPGVELRLRDATTAGVVEIRGPSLFEGYWRRPEATADAHDHDGWFATGDIGRIDPDGRLTLEGRAGDMIITGGENVYPKEIELLLDSMAGVAESAVIGVPHPEFGEAVLALVVTDADGAFDPSAVEAALGTSLARFKHPKAIHSVDALPRNTMGKVQKHALRQTWATRFSPED